jgi:long-chain acyl-CoA synthetase
MAIGFYSGDISNIKEDFAALRPTVFGSVPRLLQKLYDLIQMKFDEGTRKSFRKNFIKLGLDIKLHFLKSGGYYRHPVFDTLIFDKVRQT